MPDLRQKNALAGAALAFLMLFGLLPGSTGFALAAPPEALQRPPQALVPLAPGLMGLRGLQPGRSRSSTTAAPST